MLRRFSAIGGRRRRLVIEAGLMLATARLALLAVPFPTLARRLGGLVSPQDATVSAAMSQGHDGDAPVAAEIGWAVTRAARFLPFNAVCLPQALAAQIMLQRRGIASVIYFAAGQGQGRSFFAHAWLTAQGVEVTGYPVDDRLVTMACLVSNRSSADVRNGEI